MNAALQGRKGALHRGNTSSMADKPSFAFLEAILNCELGNPLAHSGKQCGYTLPSEEVNLWCSETTAGLAFLLTTPLGLQTPWVPSRPALPPLKGARCAASSGETTAEPWQGFLPPLPTCPTCAGFSFFLIEKGIYTFPSFFFLFFFL